MEELWTGGRRADFDPGHGPALGFGPSGFRSLGLGKMEGFGADQFQGS